MLCLAIFARCHPMRVESRCKADCPCLSFVISNNRPIPTITAVARAASRPPAIVAIMVRTRPPIMMPVPSAPSPPMPAEVGWRQLPYVLGAARTPSAAATWSLIHRVVVHGLVHPCLTGLLGGVHALLHGHRTRGDRDTDRTGRRTGTGASGRSSRTGTADRSSGA